MPRRDGARRGRFLQRRRLLDAAEYSGEDSGAQRETRMLLE